MVITVRLHANFRMDTPAGKRDRIQLQLPEGATVSAVLQALDLGLDPEHMLLAVNGRMVDEQRGLQEGDEVRVMPAISGG